MGLRSNVAIEAVRIDDAPITTDDVAAIAAGAPVELGPVARARILASREVVDRLAASEQLIYGLNTGLGHARNERLPPAVIEEGQLLTVRMHAGAIGPPLPAEVVRAAMAVRVAGMALGGSGASPPIAEAYVAMLNRRVHPVVPSVGSVGAADLMHMAAIALVAAGEGEAELDGEVLPGARALERAGLEAVRLRAKDGLTVLSANGVSVGHAALVVRRAERLADAADLVVAVSLEGIEGNPSIVDPAVARAKRVPGQRVAAERIAGYLEGSDLCRADAARSVQDPLSFRVAPQVHGAFREIVGRAREAVDGELASMDDNPLVSVGEGRMISNGNFHPMLLALAVDAIRPALTHVALLADRRTGQLWDRLVSDPAVMAPGALVDVSRWGSPFLRYSGAARAAELRTLADPATLDVAPLDVGVEDHATNAPLAVRRSEEALAVAEDVLAIELLTAGALLGWRHTVRDRMAPRTRAALERIAEALAATGRGASTDAQLTAGRSLLFGVLPELAGGG